MLGTRPDIAYSISTLGQYANNPSKEHMVALKRVFRYLRATTTASITYQRKLGATDDEQAVLYGMADSNYAQDEDDRKSVSGYAFILAGGAISWASKKQPTVAQSTTEAEYIGYNMAAREAVWLRSLLNSFYYAQPTLTPTVILADNQGAIALTKNPKFHKRTKHVDVCWHWIREKVKMGQIHAEYIPTNEMGADVLTKPLGPEAHQQCCNQFSIDTWIERVGESLGTIAYANINRSNKAIMKLSSHALETLSKISFE